MIVRPATPADTDAVLGMARRFLDETPYGTVLELSTASMEALIHQGLSNAMIFVAERHSEVIGMIAAVLITLPESTFTYAEELLWWVEPEHRTTSAGHRLWSVLEHWARQSGASVLKMIAPANSSVNVFYSDHGYEALETAWVKRLSDGVRVDPEFLRGRHEGVRHSQH